MQTKPSIKYLPAPFLAGVCIMILEMIGPRMMAPYIGATVISWAAVITVIMGSMALGYRSGGAAADKNPDPRLLAARFACAGLYILCIGLFGKLFIQAVFMLLPLNFYALALIYSLALFAVPCFMLSAASPFTVRLLIAAGGQESAGKTAGTVSAVSTAGCIAGAMLGGFILISFLGVSAILYSAAAVSLCCAVFLYFPSRRPRIINTALIVVSLAAVSVIHTLHDRAESVYETLYSTLTVGERTLTGGRSVRILSNNYFFSQGAQYTDSPYELTGGYTQFVFERAVFPETASALIFGGGAYMLPSHLAYSRPDIAVDVVEIDPKMTALASRYFRLLAGPFLRIFHNDARYAANLFLRDNRARYDLILHDAYPSSLPPPAHLITAEFFSLARRLLADDGVFAFNLLANPDSVLYASILATFQSAFPGGIAVYPRAGYTHPNPDAVFQTPTIMLLYSNRPGFYDSLDSFPRVIPTADGSILTDDFNPIELLTLRMLRHSLNPSARKR